MHLLGTSERRQPGGKPPKYENRLVFIALGAVAPALVASLALLWTSSLSVSVRWTLSAFICLCLWGGLAALRHKARFPLQTLANLVAGIRDGDFSTRARGGGSRDALGELAAELNALARQLRDQRLDSMEAAALLRKVMAEIDVGVFAFGPDQRLTLVNRAGERMLARSTEHLLGRSAQELGLADCLTEEADRLLARPFPGGGERWSLRKGSFRQGGIQTHLLMLTDLSRALREEERQAWQRLLRVFGHELNNSLAPIKSIAASLERLLAAEVKPADWQDDLRSGLSVISSRTAALTRFMEAYSQLARLPSPNLQRISLPPLIERVIRLERRVKIQLTTCPEVELLADPDQLEQLLINLVRNAADASLEGAGDQDRETGSATENAVTVGWTAAHRQVEISIGDSGPGIANPANLFVPFFTTKPGGSGIGLVLARQIAEAHGGSLLLSNRAGAPGCVATLRLNLS